MGETSQHAEGLLTQKTLGIRDMACQLVVHLSDGTFTTDYATYGAGCMVHVEDMLFHLLGKKFGNLASIPESSKIVFYGHWSPCKLCLTQTIPPKLKEMNIVARNQRVRFRFNHYYTKKAWEVEGKSVRPEAGGHYFWETNEDAQSEYDRVASLYGNFGMKSRSTATKVATSTSPRVAFMSGLGTSRTDTTWDESYRGKIMSNGRVIA